MDKEKLLKKLSKIEKELEKVRWASVWELWWQTQKLAKKQRKRDMLAQERMEIIFKLEDYE